MLQTTLILGIPNLISDGNVDPGLHDFGTKFCSVSSARFGVKMDELNLEKVNITLNLDSYKQI